MSPSARTSAQAPGGEIHAGFRAGDPGYRAGDPGYRRVAVAVFLGGVVTFSSLYSTQALLPLLGRGFGIGAGAAATSVAVTTLGMAGGLLLAGPVSDRVGRTPLMRWSLVVAAALGLLTAVAPTWSVLLCLRVGQGLALAFFPATAAAYLREEVHPAAHARASGLYVGGTAIGGMLGRLVAAVSAHLAGWRWGLFDVGLLATVCAALCWRLLPASRGFVSRSAAPVPDGVTVTAAWDGAIRPVPRDDGPAVRVLRDGAAVSDAPVRLLRLVRDPYLVGMWLLGGLGMGTFVATFNAIGYRLTLPPYRLSVAVVGFVFLVYSFGSLASTWAGRAAGRHGRPPVVLTGALVLLAGVAVTAARPLGLVMAGLVLVTCGFFAVHGVVSGWVAARAQPLGATGRASAVYLVVYYLGSSICGTEAGYAWTARGWGGVALLTGGLSLSAVMVAGVLLLGPGVGRRPE